MREERTTWKLELRIAKIEKKSWRKGKEEREKKNEGHDDWMNVV